jgi:hypothetical protein
MRCAEKPTKSRVVDCPAVSAWVTADIATRLQASPEFMNAEMFRFRSDETALIRVNRMEKLNIQTQHLGQMVCAFMSAAVPVKVIKNVRNSGIDLLVDRDHLFCIVIPELAGCFLNLACLQPVSIPEETEGETAEMEMEVYFEECIELFYDLDTPDEEEKENEN